MPFPFLLAAAAAPYVMKGVTGLLQLNQNVKRRDTTPAAATESLAMARQYANSATLPGQARAENNLARGTAAVSAAALRAGGSSSDVLASLAAADAQQKSALSDLTEQGARFQMQQQGVLRQELGRQAAYQQADQQAYEREKAALRESGMRNMFGAVDGLSQVATYGLSQGGAPGGLSGQAAGAVESLPMLSPGLRTTPLGGLPAALMPYDDSFASYGRRRSTMPMASY